jgi:hypothetical protein
MPRALPYRTASTIREIAANNQACGMHWFDPGTKSFFKSRIGAVVAWKGGKRFFVSSEQGPDGVRRYSVRVSQRNGCKIDTVGTFQAYPSHGAAVRAAKAAAGRSG